MNSTAKAVPDEFNSQGHSKTNSTIEVITDEFNGRGHSRRIQLSRSFQMNSTVELSRPFQANSTAKAIPG